MTSYDGNSLSDQKPSLLTTETSSTTLMNIEESHQQTGRLEINNIIVPLSLSSSNMNANLNLNQTESLNQASSTKVLNDSRNTDVMGKSVNKISYPLEEESIFMKDTSNEENNSQNEQNISRELVQHYQSKLASDEQTIAQQQQNIKEAEKSINVQSIQPLRNSENTSVAIEMPTIVIHSGPMPPKKNPTVKAPLTISNTIAKPSLKKKINHSQRKKKADCDIESSGTNTESDDNVSNEDDEIDDEEEYIPKKILKTHHLNNNSDSEVIVMTSDDENSLAKRKPTRVSKKPKVFEDFETSSPNCLTPQALDGPKVDISSSTIVQQQPQALLTKAKQFARKSTAPLATSNSSQNILANNNNQQQLKAQQMAPLNPKASSQIKSPITSVLSINNHQNQNNNKFSSGNSLNNAQTLNNNTTLKPLVNSSNLQQTTINSQTTSTTPVKQFRNKIVSCKPFCQSKATECYPNVRDASTQVDLDDIRLHHTVVPVPVPINVPIPMFMFQAPMPLPILLPIPIPVPVFIPTTKKTYDRVERRIKKLRKKLPSDPLEFELLLYAEKLAREEGLPGFEDSSDGESESESEPMETSSSSMQLIKAKVKSNNQEYQNSNNSESEKDNHHQQLQLQSSDQEGSFKWIYGVKVFNTWLSSKLEQFKVSSSNLNKNIVLLSQANRLPNDLVKLKNEELNCLLTEFIQDVRKPTGEVYAPESLYYLCLGIQHYLQEKGRTENIFLDFNLFDNFQVALNEITLKYQIRINSEGLIISRIEEEILWESKQLGAYSPFVLLNTILFFNTKYFFLDKKESHMQLSFTNVKKHAKRNIGPNGEDFGKTVFLRYYPDFQGLEQVIYEQGENYDNPLRCPVELYNFYLSKCPESVKNRSDVFYLLPEKASLPSSPVWFSSQPLSPKMLERMLNRIKMVKEVNELLLAAAPATTQAAPLI